MMLFLIDDFVLLHKKKCDTWSIALLRCLYLCEIVD